jgi:hypothetical protein
MAGHADAFSAACVVENVGKVAANMGDGQRQALHAPTSAKRMPVLRAAFGWYELEWRLQRVGQTLPSLHDRRRFLSVRLRNHPWRSG